MRWISHLNLVIDGAMTQQSILQLVVNCKVFTINRLITEVTLLCIAVYFRQSEQNGDEKYEERGDIIATDVVQCSHSSW